jgi:hypothetical protein
MKKCLLFVSLAIIVLPFAGAQQPISVTSDSLDMAGKKYPAVRIMIPEADMNNLKKDWKSTLGSRTKSKVVEDNGLWTVFGANGGKISATPVNVYSRTEGTDTTGGLIVAVELSKDEFAVPGSTAYSELESSLKKFAYDQYQYKVRSDLSREEDKLKDLKNELKKTKESTSDLNKDIKEAGQEIQDRNDEVSQLNQQIESLSNEINNEKSQLASAEGSAKDEKSDYVKGLEKRKKKLDKDLRSAERKISKEDKIAKEADKKIPEQEEYADSLKKKIEAQEEVVKQFQQKADAVKDLAEK